MKNLLCVFLLGKAVFSFSGILKFLIPALNCPFYDKLVFNKKYYLLENKGPQFLSKFYVV